ncbi:MAG: Ig-like domain-containing protein [Planctomycetes bacterium]|nr:Ig-like domain-containing protein [Planctomycetota bacterium]
MKNLISIFVLFALFSAISCGAGGSSGAALENVVRGYVIKGPVRGAIVRIYRVDPEMHTIGAEIANATTDDEGHFRAELNQSSDLIFIRVTSGQYESETTGQAVSLGAGDELTLCARKSSREIAITPLTHFAAFLAGRKNGGYTVDNVLTANAEIANYFGLADIVTTVPIDPTALDSGVSAEYDSVAYGLILAGFDKLAESLRLDTIPTLIDPFDIVEAFKTDLLDNDFDGKQPGGSSGSSSIPLSGGSLPTTAGVSGIATAISEFSADPQRNRSGAAIRNETLLAIGRTGGKLSQVDRIEITPEAPLLASGQSVALEPKALDSNDNEIAGLTFLWTTSDPSVATIDQSGALCAVAPGKATVRVTSGGKIASASVTVLAPVSELPEVEIVSIAPFQMTAGEVVTIVATGLNPESATSHRVYFETNTGSGAQGFPGIPTTSLNPDYDGTFLRVEVPKVATTGDLMVAATYLFENDFASKFSEPRPVTILSAADAQNRAPEISNVSPASVETGDEVTVTGQNFLSNISVRLRDSNDPLQFVIVPASSVTLAGAGTLKFKMPVGFDVQDVIAVSVQNENGRSSGFSSHVVTLSPPSGPLAQVALNLEDFRIGVLIERTEDTAGNSSLAVTVSLIDVTRGGVAEDVALESDLGTLLDTISKSAGEGGDNDATVTVSTPTNGTITLANALPNTKPGLYKTTEFAYTAGEFLVFEITGTEKNIHARAALITPGGNVTAAPDGSSIVWDAGGEQDTIDLIRTSTGQISTIEGPIIAGIGDLTSPVALSAEDYTFFGAGPSGTYTARINLRARAHIPTARTGSLFQIRNTIERTVTVP